jgi:GT2 family glycosyltransferase
MGTAPTLADLHVVIVGYGEGDQHVPLVESLVGEGVLPERVTVAHNPSAATAEPAPPPGGSLIRMERNVGYGGAVNAALRRQLDDGAELVLVLTHDFRVRPGAIAKLVEGAARAPSFGILGPVLWSRRDDRVWSYGGVRLPSGWVGHRGDPPPALDGTGVAECEWVDGAAMLVRGQVFRDIGLFEERYFMYFEETDLCLRARRAGWHVGVVIDAVSEHAPGVPSRPGAYAYLATRNGLEYARNADGLPGLLRVARIYVFDVWRLAKQYVKAARSREGRSRVKAEAAGMVVGVVDFARGRWGPPPAWLPGLGDLELTQQGPPKRQRTVG